MREYKYGCAELLDCAVVPYPVSGELADRKVICSVNTCDSGHQAWSMLQSFELPAAYTLASTTSSMKLLCLQYLC